MFVRRSRIVLIILLVVLTLSLQATLIHYVFTERPHVIEQLARWRDQHMPPVATTIQLFHGGAKLGLNKSKDSGKECSDNSCTSRLPPPSLGCYRLCEHLTYIKTGLSPTDPPNVCKFRDGQQHLPVALVSVPGSGNTWVRGLLEKATGICTGSIYCDAPLRIKGFVGEYVHDGSVLVVKTHTSDYQWRGMKVENRNHDDYFYESAILLVRNPFDTFVAERHRSILLEKAERSEEEDTSHLYRVDRGAFGNNSEWQEFVRNITLRWQKTLVKWSTSNHSVLVVRYEDLKRDQTREVTRMLDFLRQHYDRRELQERLRGGYHDFRRNHTVLYEHYTPGQRRRINAVITQTITTLTSHHLDHLFQLEEYISD